MTNIEYIIILKSFYGNLFCLKTGKSVCHAVSDISIYVVDYIKPEYLQKQYLIF